ncbi:MAG: tetratricopeptide repeat protein [candidate division FCPU426 bacterium]
MPSSKKKATPKPKPVARNKPAPKKSAAPVQPVAGPEPSAPAVTLQSSRRFWMLLLGSGAAVLLIVQGYGYLTGWGNPERVVQRHFENAQRLALAKRYPAALKEYQRVLERTKENETRRQAQIAMAETQREQSHWAEAIDLYRQLREPQGESAMNAWADLQIAECQLAAGELDQARATYQSVQQALPRTDWEAEARLGLGKVAEAAEQYEEAIRIYLALEKDYRGGFLAAEALMGVGECQQRLNDTAAARCTYQLLLDQYPSMMNEEAKKQLQRLEGNVQPEGIRRWGE